MAEIERRCALCGKIFKCVYEDEESRAWAEAWEICPDCWKNYLTEGEEDQETQNQNP